MELQRIAVLMTCHNRKEKTLSCLNHLYLNTIPQNVEMEIYLVDDGSSDGTGQAVATTYPQVHLIQGDGNLYWNRGMHRAWSEAAAAVDYDYYLLLNDDTDLMPQALQELLAASRECQDLSPICGSTAKSQNSEQTTYGGYSNRSGLIQPTQKIQECDYFNGNCVLIPRHVYQIVGKLDPHFRHSLGDFDYGIRARKHGIRLFIAPNNLGYCDEHDREPKWRRTDVKVRERLKSLYSPLGCNPIEFFTFDRRRSGVVVAVLHFFTIHARAIAPRWFR